jgi:D-alanyl-D-alanine carboxypeptidase/D-alanyl-D-alanine-endopeptidase (penicillin-binding protein 4)
LKAFLLQRNIVVEGKVQKGKTPSSAKKIASYESKNLSLILADMNKFSNNYVAEMLTKSLGASSEKSGTVADGMKVIRQHMKSLNVPEDQMNIESPSGLSRENKMSSQAMWKVLQHLRNDFRIQPEFLTSLPIAGIDGTLKKRMKGSTAERWIRAKTGYINNVVSLAGYAGLEDGRVITFTFIYNGSTDEAKVRQFFDNLLISLLK